MPEECGYECSKRHDFCESCPDPSACIQGYVGPHGELLTPSQYLKVLDEVMKKLKSIKIKPFHSCTDCAISSTCKHVPLNDEQARINCPLWTNERPIVKDCSSCMCTLCSLNCKNCTHCDGTLTHCNDFLEER